MNTDESIILTDDRTDEDAEVASFAVRRRELSELSEFFERDARRYDSGFGG